jgi:hypothetical protein
MAIVNHMIANHMIVNHTWFCSQCSWAKRGMVERRLSTGRAEEAAASKLRARGEYATNPCGGGGRGNQPVLLRSG